MKPRSKPLDLGLHGVKILVGDVVEVNGGDEAGGHPVLHEGAQVLLDSAQPLLADAVASPEG